MAPMDYSQYFPSNVRKWEANTVYAAGSQVVLPNPDNTIGRRVADGISRNTYDATEQGTWTKASGSGGGGPLPVDSASLLTGKYIQPVASSGNRALSIGQIWACPIYIPSTLSLQSLSVNVTAAGTAGAVCRLGIYTNDPSDLPRPKTLVAEASALADISATGLKTVPIASGNLSAGLYWLACKNEVAGGSVTGAGWPFQEFSGLSAPPYANPVSFMSGQAAGPLPASWAQSGTDVTFALVWARIS